MIIYAEVKIPGYLGPTRFAFQTKWSEDALRWNLSRLLREYFSDGDTYTPDYVTVVDTAQPIETYQKLGLGVFTSVDQVATALYRLWFHGPATSETPDSYRNFPTEIRVLEPST